jgi:hypothetical protein
MREIKFDFVWKSKSGSFIHNKHTLEEIMGGDHYDAMSDNPMLRDYVLIAKRQYTGLNDKNGVDIYEGDIVLHRKAGFSEKVHGEVFIEPTRGVVVKSWPISFDIEVIGNKYEHPELLEEEA